MLLLLPLAPMLTAALIVAARGRPRVLAPLAVGGLLVTLGLGLWAASSSPSASLSWGPVIDLGLAVEGFGRVMIVLVPLIAAPIVAYAAATEEQGRARLLALMLAFVGAMLLLVVAADLLTLLIAWEIIGALSWALIAHDWRDPANTRAAAQAFLTTRLGDLGLYVAAGATFAVAGSFAFADLALVGRPGLDIVAAGVLLAAAAKSAQVPFSPWLFAAMAGPTPVSALLHSATLVAAGAYLLIRLSPVLEKVGWFLTAVAAVGLLTALAGGVVAMLQTQAKRVLAASTSAQYGLMFVAIGAGSTAAAGGHLVAHAAFKSLLFLGAGVAIHAAGTGHLGSLRLGRALPRVAALSAVGALALAAVPPLGAAWTKDTIVSAAVEASLWLGTGVLAAGALSALYAGRYQLLAYGRTAGGGTHTDESLGPRPGRAEAAALIVLASITVGLSVLWLPGGGQRVETLTGGELVAGAPWELMVALGSTIAGLGLAWWLGRRGRLLDLGLRPGFQTAMADWLGLPAATSRLIVRPVIAVSAALARFDDRVVDAGVRRVAWFAGIVSGLFSRRGELAMDGVVRAVAAGTLRTAAASRVADDTGIDGAVEVTGRGVGRAGHASRRLQTGLSHDYYLIAAIGLAAVAAILAMAR